MIIDLHTHSSHSDGQLSPTDLLSRAAEHNVDLLAMTDHDTVNGYADLPGDLRGVSLISGIELSTCWQGCNIHVVGLNFDLNSEAIRLAAQSQTDARARRAMRIAEALEKQGITGAWEGALGQATGDYIGRPHFARHIVATGRARSMQAAFKKYLAHGKAGDVKLEWAELSRVIDWIRDAGGLAVLAHPLKYKLTRSRLKRLVDDFRNLGGQGMEVVSGQQQFEATHDMAALCCVKGLLGSVGSDFHEPDRPWAELGRVATLPSSVDPVWDHF